MGMEGMGKSQFNAVAQSAFKTSWVIDFYMIFVNIFSKFNLYG